MNIWDTFSLILCLGYFMMLPDRFNHLLFIVEPLIRKSDTMFRKSISASERPLALTWQLFLLATGASQQTLSYSFRIGRATVSKIVSKACQITYSALKEKCL